MLFSEMPRKQSKKDYEKLRYKTDDAYREKRKKLSNKRWNDNRNSALWPSIQRRRSKYYQDNREKILARSNERYRNEKLKNIENSFCGCQTKLKKATPIDVSEKRKESLAKACKRLGLNLGTIKRRIYIYKIPREEALEMKRPRNIKLIEYKGRKKTLMAWCKSLGLAYGTVRLLINKMSVKEAFNMPPRKVGRPKKPR